MSAFNLADRITNDQVAAYAQGDIHLTSRLTATIGERVARVKSDWLFNAAGVYLTGVPPVSRTTLEETPSTPKAALSYQADTNNLFYVSAGKGFRIGGGNPGVGSSCDATPPTVFKSDYVWSYEVGAKNKLFDGRLQIDSSVFHIDWSKIQQNVIIASCGEVYTTNAASAVSNGFDLALQGIVTDRLRVNLAVGYSNAYYTSNVYDTGGHPLILAGDKIGFIPQVNAPWNVSTSANYEIPLRQGDKIRLRGEYKYSSRNPGPFITQIPTSASYFPLMDADPPIHQTNARVIYTRDKLDVSLFMDNIFNSHPLLSVYQDTAASNLFTYSTLRPRTVGLSANIGF
jgi:iron complex outermembrane recepter protein